MLLPRDTEWCLNLQHRKAAIEVAAISKLSVEIRTEVLPGFFSSTTWHQRSRQIVFSEPEVALVVVLYVSSNSNAVSYSVY